MGVKNKKPKYRALMKKREIYKMTPFDLDKDKALSFVCDSIAILPTKKSICGMYNLFDIALFKAGYPICRLKSSGDILHIEPSSEKLELNVMYGSKLVNIYPTMGRLRVDWDGVDLHLTRLPDEHETV